MILQFWTRCQYELTEEILGRPFEVAEAYAVEYIEGANYSATAEELAALFLARHNESGLPEVELLFRTGPPGARQFWTFAFAGCEPENCTADVRAELIVAQDEDEWLKHSSGSALTRNETMRVYEADSGLSWATVTTFLNASGRVVSYSVNTHRYVQNSIEGFFAQVADGQDRPIVHAVIFERNLALERSVHGGVD